MGSRILFFCRADSTRWFTYSKHRCHAHIQGLQSTAPLQQHSILDLHTAEALHQSGDSTVAAPDHSIQHTPLAIEAPPLSAVQSPPLRAYFCTRVLGTKEGDFSSRIYLPSATYLNFVNAEFLVLASFFFVVFFALSGWGSPLSCFCADIHTTYSMGTVLSLIHI